MTGSIPFRRVYVVDKYIIKDS